MSLVLPAGLSPEGHAGAEYHVKISLSHSQFGETEVGAEYAAHSCTTTLPAGSTAGASSALSMPGKEKWSLSLQRCAEPGMPGGGCGCCEQCGRVRGHRLPGHS